MNPIVVVPARLGATRLPGKPLAGIGGVPMIVHVLRRAREAGIGPVLAACAEEEIAAVARAAGFDAVLTDPALPSGSDRVHAAVEAFDPARAHDVVVNLQGDLPTLPPEHLRRVLAPLDDSGFDIATPVAGITMEKEADSPAVVKAVCAFPPGRDVAPALYFSRARAPGGEGPLWHHVGVYAFRRSALARFVALPPSPLELRERLEQLRALEAGMRIGCVRVDAATPGVDTADDLARTRAAFSPGRVA